MRILLTYAVSAKQSCRLHLGGVGFMPGHETISASTLWDPGRGADETVNLARGRIGFKILPGP